MESRCNCVAGFSTGVARTVQRKQKRQELRETETFGDTLTSKLDRVAHSSAVTGPFDAFWTPSDCDPTSELVSSGFQRTCRRMRLAKNGHQRPHEVKARAASTKFVPVGYCSRSTQPAGLRAVTWHVDRKEHCARGTRSSFGGSSVWIDADRGGGGSGCCRR